MRHVIQLPGIELGEELGRGSYSVVYRARQGTRPCAVKVPLVRGRWTRWVYREAVALARVHHPGLAEIIEVSEVDDLPYIVMELVEGETLADRLSRGALTPDEAIKIAIQLVAALGAVHAVGIVHRDVKPRNIALGRDGRVRLIDFGFATPIELAGRESEHAGTRAYAAPEQFHATAQIDGRTDLYAVGRVLVECLVGRAPRAVAAPELGEIAVPAVDPRLDPILAGLVRQAPDARYPDARALLRDLELVRAGGTALGPGAYEPERRAPPLVGRIPELERITRGWQGAGANVGALALVLGCRGSGKSRVLDACAAKARDIGDRRVLEVSCRAGDPPLATLRRIFEAYAASIRKGTAEARAAGEQAARAAMGDRLAPFARLIAPGLSDLFGPDGGTAEAAAGAFPDAAAELLVRLARGAGPLLICIDDLQWIDPVSRETVTRLAERAQDAPISLLLASRSAAATAPALEPLLTMDRSRLSVVELAVFAEPQVAALIALHLGSEELPPDLVRRVVALADGTPLGVLEVLGTFLDCGALRPHAGGWKLDVARAEHVTLPAGALVLLGRRLEELPPATRRVLEAAAVVGTIFDGGIVARVVRLDVSDLEYALAEARRAGLVVSNEQSHRFVHDSLREMLIEDLDVDVGRSLHQRVAEILDEGSNSTFETICATALHYAAGELERTPTPAYRAARAAAEAALERFDNETALRFLDLARGAARVGGLGLDASFHRSGGEAHLRLGALDESLRSFESALQSAQDLQTRATILGRIAWVYQAQGEPERAWATLERAFDAVGARMPVETAASAAQTIRQIARAAVGKAGGSQTPILGDARARVELIFDLHYQNARLGSDYGKPFRLVQSTLDALALSEPLGRSRAHARSRVMYGLLLAALGRHDAALREVESAAKMATELGDPTTSAFCVQVRAMTACFAGDFERALVHLRECLDHHGSWLELNEYCLIAATGDHLESLRGKPVEAMVWIARAIDRQRQAPRIKASSAGYLAHRATATLASLGRVVVADSWLATQTAKLRSLQSSSQSFNGIVSWGPRARTLLENGNFGAEFEELVRAFDAEQHNPRTAHSGITEYYVAVAHARVNQCLSVPRAQRAAPIEKLRKAAADLRAAAKLPLYKAHALFIDGCVAWFGGSVVKARRAFADAEALAQAETCPWIVSEVARLRAHMLIDGGNDAAGRDQARFAEMLARENGAVPRAKRIRDEFALPDPTPAVARPPSSRSSAQSSSRARRQLSALLRAVQKPSAELKPSEQMEAILDDLIQDVEADRGFLSFRPDADAVETLLVARGREAVPTVERRHHQLMRHVHESGECWPPEDQTPVDSYLDIDSSRVLAFPLFLYGRVVGTVCLERLARAPSFTLADRDLLLLLSHQVPVAIEVARLVAERERLQASLVRGQKLEAVGQLAGAIAHEFNNTLMVMRISLDSIEGRAPREPELKHDLKVIADATDRATMLTRQLLSFSSHQPAPPTICSVNELISSLQPVLAKLMGPSVVLEMRLDPNLHAVSVVRELLDQVIVNLAVNAREAMPDGGTLRLETRNVVLDEKAVAYGARQAGAHVTIELTDTGRGMNAEVSARAFDPFFTTKPKHQSAGIGLTTVYAFAKNFGGYVDVSSEVGRGTTFLLCLPSAGAFASTQSSFPSATSPHSTSATQRGRAILVVDDDPFIRRMMARILVREHYAVLVASNGDEALALASQHDPDIGVVILDVLMPGMTGPELGRRLAQQYPAVRQIFMSGYAPENLPVETNVGTDFLQKPFSSVDLIARVQRILGA